MSTATEKTDILNEAQMHYQSLLGSFQSIILGTVDKEGIPDASYAPAVIDESRNLYIYISALSQHTGNIRGNGLCSALIIEDESLSDQLFARKRITFACKAEKIERDTPEWNAQIADFQDKFGKLMEHLKTMQDFDLFRLVPVQGGWSRASVAHSI